jgi:cell division inhibitor SepF
MRMMNKFMNFLGLQEEEAVDRERTYDAADDQEQKNSTYDVRKVKNNVVSLHAQKSSKIVLTEPRNYEETQTIADHLRARKTVLINLQRLKSDQAMRIVDFLSGTVYALNGNISKVGSNIFVCTPDSVEVQGSISDMTKDNS